MELIHKMGWLPDYPSPMRAMHPFKATAATAAPDWKLTTDPSMKVGMFPPEEQNTNDCVARAVVGALEYLVFKTFHKKIKFSDRFPYYVAREAFVSRNAGMAISDSGCFPLDLLAVAYNIGIPLEYYCPNDAFMVNAKPTDAAYNTEERVYLTDLESVETLPKLLKTLSERNPVVHGTWIFENFYFSGPDKDGFVPEPAGRQIGGHYDLSVGADRRREACETRGSWGDWGPLHGWYWRKWSYLMNPAWCDQPWALKSVRADFLK